MPSSEQSAPRVRGSFRLLAPEITGPVLEMGPGGNYARAGAGDIRREARGVTPSSDVNGGATTIPNLGTAAGAGMVSGARNGVVRVLEIP